LVPSRYRLAYLPRTPPCIVAKSYSERRPLFGLVFFIKVLFSPRGSRGDDSNRVRDNKYASTDRLSDSQDLCSFSEWSWSGNVVENGSAKVVAASRKSIPCFFGLLAAFLASHWKITNLVITRHIRLVQNRLPMLNSDLGTDHSFGGFPFEIQCLLLTVLCIKVG
jgi:hypothetical protein